MVATIFRKKPKSFYCNHITLFSNHICITSHLWLTADQSVPIIRNFTVHSFCDLFVRIRTYRVALSGGILWTFKVFVGHVVKIAVIMRNINVLTSKSLNSVQFDGSSILVHVVKCKENKYFCSKTFLFVILVYKLSYVKPDALATYFRFIHQSCSSLILK